MIDQRLSGQLSKQLIQDLDYSNALNKGFVLALNYEIGLLKLMVRNLKMLVVGCLRHTFSTRHIFALELLDCKNLMK